MSFKGIPKCVSTVFTCVSGAFEVRLRCVSGAFGVHNMPIVKLMMV